MSAPHRSVRELDDGTFERKCYSCDAWKPQTLEHFYEMRSACERMKNRTHMYHAQCRPCARLAQKERKKKDPKKQTLATRRVRDNTRELRYKALDLFEQVQTFLAELPLVGTVDQLCERSRRLKAMVDIYILTEAPHVRRSKEMLPARRDGQKRKYT